MASTPKNGAWRQHPSLERKASAGLTQVVAASLALLVFGVSVGCDKIPTWDEIVHGKKAPAPAPVAPVVQQPKPAAPVAPVKPPEPPKKTPQEVMSKFNQTPTQQRTEQMLIDLANSPEARDQYTELNLNFSSVSDAGIATLPKFEKVEKLSLDNCQYTNGAMANVAKMKGVTSLSMAGGAVKEPNSDAAMSQIKQMKGLIELRVDRAKFSLAGVKEIGEMTSLESLSLNSVPQFSDEHLEALSGLVNLKYLDLSSTNVTDKGFQYLKPFTELETLKLTSMSSMRGLGLQELVKRKGLSKLRILSVASNPYLNVAAYEGISHLSNLESLDAGDAEFGDYPFIHALPTLRKLEQLFAYRNAGLSDSAILQTVPKMRKLKVLYFEQNPGISDASLPAIAKVRTLEKVSFINTMVTEQGAQVLKKKLKDCKINFNGKIY